MSANIRNGYTEIQGAIESLKRIERLLKEDLSLSLNQKVLMRQKRKHLVEYITYHQLTEQMLKSFQLISPELYSAIDTLKDRKGREVDVYVRFVPEKALPAGVAGTTNIGQDETDPDAYRSEYGLSTVSVTIAAVKKSLHLLAHEFGHVEYQVQNLAAYISFYNAQYVRYAHNRKSVGHNDGDLSGRRAFAFVMIFHEKYLGFVRSSQSQSVSHTTLLHRNQKAGK